MSSNGDVFYALVVKHDDGTAAAASVSALPVVVPSSLRVGMPRSTNWRHCSRGATATSSVCGCCAAAARFLPLRFAWRVRLTAKAAAACSGARLRASLRAASPFVPCSFEHAGLHPLLYFHTPIEMFLLRRMMPLVADAWGLPN